MRYRRIIMRPSAWRIGGLDGGIVVTASHNPADYNGLKFVTKGARPVTGEAGLKQMAELIVNGGICRHLQKNRYRNTS